MVYSQDKDFYWILLQSSAQVVLGAFLQNARTFSSRARDRNDYTTYYIALYAV